jgi:hypothetical protein
MGGVELLLRVHRLPRVKPTYGFLAASHLLLSAFRLLAPAQPQQLALKTKAALSAALDEALPAVQAVGSACVPALPAEQRDAYVRVLLATAGTVAVGSAVARNATQMLQQVGAAVGGPGLSGKLEFAVWQLQQLQAGAAPAAVQPIARPSLALALTPPRRCPDVAGGRR